MLTIVTIIKLVLNSPGKLGFFLCFNKNIILCTNKHQYSLNELKNIYQALTAMFS